MYASKRRGATHEAQARPRLGGSTCSRTLRQNSSWSACASTPSCLVSPAAVSSDTSISSPKPGKRTRNRNSGRNVMAPRALRRSPRRNAMQPDLRGERRQIERSVLQTKADAVSAHPVGRSPQARSGAQWKDACVWTLSAHCNHGGMRECVQTCCPPRYARGRCRRKVDAELRRGFSGRAC